jgi:hypothetical protein
MNIFQTMCIIILTIATGAIMATNFNDSIVQQFMNFTLGKPIDIVFHATVPFHFGYDAGGAADVYQYKRPDGNINYITGDLIGEPQKSSDAGNYELLIVMKDDEQWGANLIRMLAFSTLDESFNSGETMDIGSFGKEVGFDAIVFDKYASTMIDAKEIGIMLVLGITKKELNWKIKNGGKELIIKLKENGIYPFSIPKRKSIIK